MEYSTDEINRQVHFGYAQVFDPEDDSGDNNTFIYNRAPDGYKFILHKISLSIATGSYDQGIVMLFDGHEYTHWDLWPNIQSNEVLFRGVTNSYTNNIVEYLEHWSCKEYTIGLRSKSESEQFKVLIIVWYYLQKMSKLDRLHYAVTQPKSILGRHPKAFRTTVESTED
jgi:hypothetical protein